MISNSQYFRNFQSKTNITNDTTCGHVRRLPSFTDYTLKCSHIVAWHRDGLLFHLLSIYFLKVFQNIFSLSWTATLNHAAKRYFSNTYSLKWLLESSTKVDQEISTDLWWKCAITDAKCRVRQWGTAYSGFPEPMLCLRDVLNYNQTKRSLDYGLSMLNWCTKSTVWNKPNNRLLPPNPNQIRRKWIEMKVGQRRYTAHCFLSSIYQTLNVLFIVPHTLTLCTT